MSTMLAFVASILIIGQPPPESKPLNPGDPAPAFRVGPFLKGEPFARFEPGKVYVLEFWATWCGPCVAGMPRLTEIQKKYPEVRIVGVGVWETAQDAGAAFVAQQGEAIGYSIATDAIPNEGDANSGHMATAWLGAAGLTSIPAAFVVGKTGKVEWIGHPDVLADAIPLALEGKLDTAGNREALQAKRQADLESREFRTEAMKLTRARDAVGLRAVYARRFAAHPEKEAEGECCLFFAEILQVGQEREAIAYGEKCVDSFLRTRRGYLELLAKDCVDPRFNSQPTPALAEFALKALAAVDRIAPGGKDDSIHYIRAQALAVLKRFPEAIAEQEAALSREPNETRKRSLQETLEGFRRAANRPQ